MKSKVGEGVEKDLFKIFATVFPIKMFFDFGAYS
jgi:hypothetical protein